VRKLQIAIIILGVYLSIVLLKQEKSEKSKNLKP